MQFSHLIAPLPVLRDSGAFGIEFGRPSMLLVRGEGDPIVITPLMESERVAEMTWVEDIRRREDAGQNSWALALNACLSDAPKELCVEQMEIPAIVRHFIDDRYRVQNCATSARSWGRSA